MKNGLLIIQKLSLHKSGIFLQKRSIIQLAKELTFLLERFISSYNAHHMDLGTMA